uniref:helix-turn-helix domain-containing protein n=1 Tax=Streptosporangium sp. CA-235898 TaxID=3240073 RepID=UPI003F492E43
MTRPPVLADRDEAGKTNVPVREVIGLHLRKLRNERGITASNAGEVIGASVAKVSRLERGLLPFRPEDLAALLTLYGLNRFEQEMIISVAVGNRDLDRWDRNAPAPETVKYIPLDEVVKNRFVQTADLIRSYDPLAVPELLQTPAYATALYCASRYPPPPPSVVERAVMGLQARQQVLESDKSPLLWVVVEEPALRRPVGGAAVHSQQLSALISAARNPKIRIRINPMGTSFLPICGPFTVFRFVGGTQMVAVHDLGVDKIADWKYDEERVMTFERAAIAARPSSKTTAILTTIRADLYPDHT